MNKIALALILLILPFSLAYTSPRKKVGIVLSGGGAKGVAHIGVIKALEELNIPIDYIAGTSIGAIIGGLYSIGYTSEQLETIVKQTDWIDLLTDKVSRKEIPFPFKSDDSKYLISFPINNCYAALYMCTNFVFISLKVRLVLKSVANPVFITYTNDSFR